VAWEGAEAEQAAVVAVKGLVAVEGSVVMVAEAETAAVGK